LVATALDTSSNASSFTLMVDVENPADTTPPSVAITSPTGGTRIGNAFSVNASATDNVRVSKVELWADGKLIGTSTSATCSFSVNSRKWSAGNHSLIAKAYDPAGNAASSAAVSVTK
jgi:hypothetical protein